MPLLVSLDRGSWSRSLFSALRSFARQVPIDYQLVHRAQGEFDVAYFLSMSLTTEARRAHEVDLIRGYVADHLGFVEGKK